jgi:cell division protein FtsI/penicillin-binding protein 2
MNKVLRATQLSLAWVLAVLVLLSAAFASPATIASTTKPKSQISENSTAQKRLSRVHHRRRRHHYYERFYTSSFATDTTDGDVSTGEDASVRAAAIDALGNMNGTVVAIDPASGRILAMVNQKLALSEGAQPCSTFKVAVALAALKEGVITKDREVKLGRRTYMNLTDALAHSNNAYFEALGRRLGFKRVSEYAHMFGMGELAGFNIIGEHLGEFPTVAPGMKDGGVGKMCSYGESISMTPLQLGAMMVAVANGGTLYYLQHPQSPDDVANFVPHVKRQLDIAPLLPDVYDGMAGAVEYGTARSVRYNFDGAEILGKTGTCSKDGTRFGWFASYASTDHGRIVVVVFLRGGRPTFGPKAAEIAGRMYHNLYSNNFADTKPETPRQAPTGVATGISQ